MYKSLENLNSFSIFFHTNNDAPESWGLFFIDNTTPQIEGLEELHNNIMFYSAMILFAVSWTMFSIILNYKCERNLDSCYPVVESNASVLGYTTLMYLAYALFHYLISSPNPDTAIGDNLAEGTDLLTSLDTWLEILRVEYFGYHDPIRYEAFFYTEELIQLAELRWERFNDFISVLEHNQLDDCEFGDEFNDLADQLRETLNNLTSFYREMQADLGLSGLEEGMFEN